MIFVWLVICVLAVASSQFAKVGIFVWVHLARINKADLASTRPGVILSLPSVLISWQSLSCLRQPTVLLNSFQLFMCFYGGQVSLCGPFLSKCNQFTTSRVMTLLFRFLKGLCHLTYYLKYQHFISMFSVEIYDFQTD